jgi:hypothetical protein
VDLLDSLSGSANELVVESVVVHGETDRRDKVEPLVSLLVADHLSRVGKSDGVSHVDLFIRESFPQRCRQRTVMA